MISIVIPVFNEKESLDLLLREIARSFGQTKKSYEVIFVDDGSTDGSFDVLQGLEKKNKNIHVFSFRKNEGKAEALSLGFTKSKGEIIVTLDADLQDNPSDIRKLIAKLEEGYDLVCGWRKHRRDPLKKVISSKMFNYSVGLFWGLKLHDYNCGLKAYTKEATQSLHMYGGMHRFIPLLVFQQGFKVTEEVVSHNNRKYGKSKYGFSKLWKDSPDIFTMIFLSKYRERPLHFFGNIGGILILAGVIILGYLTFIWLQGESIGRRPLLFLGMLLVLGGFQVFFTGFLADLMINISKKEKSEFNLKYPQK